MTKKMLKSLVRLYDHIYSDSPYRRLKVVSFLCYKGKIVSFGVNTEKTSPMQNFYRIQTSLGSIVNFLDKEHSEINCLRKTNVNLKWNKVEFVVISKHKDGTFRMARPCPTCMSALKSYGIKKIIYTTSKNNKFEFEEI